MYGYSKCSIYVYVHTVSPNKQVNLVTILNLRLASWHATSQALNTFTKQPSWAEVDKLNIVFEFLCLLGLTVHIC